MSRAPFVLGKAEAAFSREARMFDSTMGARFPNPRFTAAFGDDTMPQTADNIAADLGIGRAASDDFALASQQKYQAALAAVFFAGQIHPVPPAPRGKTAPPKIATAH